MAASTRAMGMPVSGNICATNRSDRDAQGQSRNQFFNGGKHLMCGICGIVTSDRDLVIESDRLLAMRDSIAHRGPDDAGHYLDGGIALGSRRLSILDLSAHGHMPMTTPDRRYSIAYNGEVYNYRDFIPELEGRGYRLRSSSDTEVVLNLYAEYGPAMLD